MKTFLPLVAAFGGLLAAPPAVATPAARPEPSPSRVIEDWQKGSPAALQLQGLSARQSDSGELELTTTTASPVPELSLRAPAAGWSIAEFAEVAIPVRNLGPTPLIVTLRLDDRASRQRANAPLRNASRCEAAVPPGGQTFWLVAPLGGPASERETAARTFISLVGAPREFARRGATDGTKVVEIRLLFPDQIPGQRLAVGAVTARGTPAPLRGMPVDAIFPLVDSFGQYRHRDWPGKVRDEADLVGRQSTEAADLAGHARPSDWNEYGGWAKGPQYRATGFFRVEKINGVWWMIDPTGRLFWSHGVVRVGTRIRVGGIYRGTPLPEREHFFALPAKDSPLGAFFGTEPQGTRGYYVGRHNHPVYDFLEANLYRKYGPAWVQHYARQAQRRLASWGINTIANSSDPEVFRRRQTPYTAVVYSAPMGGEQFRLAGSTGNWGKLPDPFDPGWSQLMQETLVSELREAAGDPWCLGFFVDNELHWGSTTYLAEATIASPAGQPAKRVFLADLQKKYATVRELNAAWGTTHADWNAWLAETRAPSVKRPGVKADLEAFSEHYLDAYFRGCRDAIKSRAPNQLYLGCRFAQQASLMVMRAAVRYCDVISINRYAPLVRDLELPGGLDRPIIIGEFHFGALDRGPLASALVPVTDQNARAIAYRLYVESALRNPRIVGTHWFQYFDQPTTGRFDGENYQTGLVDICDTPYPETIAAVRAVAATLYSTRAALRP